MRFHAHALHLGCDVSGRKKFILLCSKKFIMNKNWKRRYNALPVKTIAPVSALEGKHAASSDGGRENVLHIAAPSHMAAQWWGSLMLQYGTQWARGEIVDVTHLTYPEASPLYSNVVLPLALAHYARQTWAEMNHTSKISTQTHTHTHTHTPCARPQERERWLSPPYA